VLEDVEGREHVHALVRKWERVGAALAYVQAALGAHPERHRIALHTGGLHGQGIQPLQDRARPRAHVHEAPHPAAAPPALALDE
jgi:hypothetical protein